MNRCLILVSFLLEFVRVLCSEGVGEGTKKKAGPKKNKRDRKTREKTKENKENQQQTNDGLLRGEKPKEVRDYGTFYVDIV